MDKQQASIHYNIGRELVAKGKLHSALKHYAQATILNANHAKAWNNMGNLQKRLGNFKQAISCYEASIKADNSPYAWVNLGNTFLTLGDGGRSVDCYLQALKQEPSHILASVNLGVSLIEQ
ncbi:MAG: tetratricopeptide repeat protein, partial [Desulfobacterales bacterium]|nr:tetratricopeptide repeat protein [Desulfobacterales bacterium]